MYSSGVVSASMKRPMLVAAPKTPSAPANESASVGPVKAVLEPATRMVALLCAST